MCALSKMVPLLPKRRDRAPLDIMACVAYSALAYIVLPCMKVRSNFLLQFSVGLSYNKRFLAHKQRGRGESPTGPPPSFYSHISHISYRRFSY